VAYRPPGVPSSVPSSRRFLDQPRTRVHTCTGLVRRIDRTPVWAAGSPREIFDERTARAAVASPAAWNDLVAELTDLQSVTAKPCLHDTTSWQTGCTTRFDNRVCQTGFYNRIDNRFDNPDSQPVGCFLHDTFDNRLYRVNGISAFR